MIIKRRKQMATKKRILTTHLQKTDTTENWSKAISFTPGKGQIIYYQDEGQPIRYKVGDGKTLLRDLPFENEIVTYKEYNVEGTVETFSAQTIYDERTWSSFMHGNAPAMIKIKSPYDEVFISDYEDYDDGSGDDFGRYYKYTFTILVNSFDFTGEDEYFKLTGYFTTNHDGILGIEGSLTPLFSGFTASDFFSQITITLFSNAPIIEQNVVNKIIAGEGIEIVNEAGKATISSAIDTSKFVSNEVVNDALNKKANLVDGKVPYEELPTMDLYLTTTDEETVDKIPSAESVRDCLSKKIEGYSSKYNVVEKGWHRVLNTIRGNPGQLYLTLTDGYSLQSLEIDLAGFVRLNGGIETPDDVGYLFCKSNSSYMYPRHSTVQSDPYFKYKITAMRMGYASQEALKEKFDPDVSAGISINSYIDVYIDYNHSEDADKNAQLLVQFTGKSDQHNSYRIDEETTDTNYVITAGNNIGEQVTLEHGLYGEELEFINVPIREDYDSVDEGYKSKLVDDFSIKVSDDDGNHTKLNEAHNIKDISKIVIPYGFPSSDTFNFRLHRKYNLLPLFSCHSSNDFFSRYNWKGNAINGKYKGGNLIYPFRSGKKTVGGVHYGITSAGTIIFDGGDTPSSIQNINVYYSNQEETAIRLPAGTYMTNVNDLYYTSDLSAPTQTKVLLSNFVGSTITNKCFKLDSPKYLTFARICVTPNDWPLDSSELGVCTPFLIKVPDDIQLGSKSNNAYTITDERWKNFSIKSSLEGEYPDFSVNADGWLELADRYSDYIIINDTYNNEVHHINKFDEFYTSWRAKGTYLNGYKTPYADFSYIREINFNKNQVDNLDAPISDNELLQVYNMFSDRSENPYDTLFMFGDNIGEFINESEIHHNDIKNIKDAFSGNTNSHIEVDSELSDVSENPVQNKVISKALEDCIKRYGDEFGSGVEILPGITCYYDGESSCITVEHMYGTATITGNSIKIQGAYLDESSSYFNITLQSAGSQNTNIEASDDVKQAFKDWLGISDTVVNNLVEQKLDTIAEEESW
jgi:hypothetical protein